MLNSVWNKFVGAVLRTIFRVFSHYRPVEDLTSYDKAGLKRILLIMTTGIGDTLLCTPAVSTTRASFPDSVIGVLCHKRNKGLVMYNDDIDVFIEYAGKGKKVFKLVREMRRHRFDIVVVLHGNDPDIVPLAYLSGARHVIGNRNSKFNFLLSEGVSTKGLDKHTIEYRVDSVRTIGADQPLYSMKLNVPQELEVEAEMLLEKYSLSNRKLVGFIPVGSNRRNRWPSEYFAMLGNIACEYDKDLRILVFGGKRDREIVGRVSHGMQVKPACFDGSLSLIQTAAMLKKCEVVVSNDTGLMHMALALKVPVIVIYGAASPRLTGPYRCSSFCATLRRVECEINEVCFDSSCGTVKCLRNILPEEVWGVLKGQALEKG